VISQACQIVAEVCILFIKKDISSMATYFAQHQLCLQLQLKALHYRLRRNKGCIWRFYHKGQLRSRNPKL